MDPILGLLLGEGLPALGGGRTDAYSYSRQSPLTYSDPLGLQPTMGPGSGGSCGFYDDVCQEAGCNYPCKEGAKYCRSLGSVLNIFDSDRTRVCIRECLVDQYSSAFFGGPLPGPGCDSCETCPNDSRCVTKSCLAKQHRYCFQRCDSKSWWPGLFPSGIFFPTDGC